jgi:hypothetical protein
MPAIFWETSLSTLFLTGIVWLALVCQRRPSARLWAVMGTSAGAAILVNPALALVMVGVLCWTAYQTRSAPPRLPVIGFLVLLAVFAPWPIRNALSLHHFIPLRSNFGFELWNGNRPGGTGDFDSSFFPIENKREHADYVSKGEVAYMRDKSALAEAYILAHPAEFAANTAKRVVRFWTGTGGIEVARLAEADAIATSLLGLLGLVMLARRRMAAAMLFMIPLALFPLPYYITHADLRFRLMLDPLLIVLSAYAVARLAVSLKQARRLPAESPDDPGGAASAPARS